MAALGEGTLAGGPGQAVPRGVLMSLILCHQAHLLRWLALPLLPWVWSENEQLTGPTVDVISQPSDLAGGIPGKQGPVHPQASLFLSLAHLSLWLRNLPLW